MASRRSFVAVVAVVVVVVAGCAGGGDGLAITDPAYLAGATGMPLPLGGRVQLAGLDQTIAYPEGWHAGSDGPYTNIAPNPSDVGRWFRGVPVEGPVVFFEVETVDFVRSVGVEAADPSPDDLLEFSTRYFGWDDVRDQQRLTLFGGEGVQVLAEERRGHVLAIQGVLPGERVILITVVAPTAAGLDEMLPTWRAMTRSLDQPVSGPASPRARRTTRAPTPGST